MSVTCRRLVVLWSLVCLAHELPAQQYRIAPNFADSVTFDQHMRELATEVLARYTDQDRERALDNRFRLEIAAGKYAGAAQSLAELRALRVRRHPRDPQARALDAQYEIWSRAMANSRAPGVSFDAAFATAFRDVFTQLDNATAALAIRALSFGIRPLQGTLRTATQAVGTKTTTSETEALALVRVYQRVLAHTSFSTALIAPLIDEDDARRYVVARNVQVKTADGATICALVVRPKATRQVPTLMTFNIYVDSASNVSDARRAASNGYAGVVGFTRGKACSPDAPVAYRFDGADGATLVDWIAAQPWSDARVGMYGGSYTGFTAWAVAKHQPKALKAIMVGAPVAPGLDVPAEGNIVWNFIYPWPFYTTNNKTLDNATYYDNDRWFKLSRQWYVSGRAYRDLPAIDGTANPTFMEWLAHPAYDAYWQDMIPYRQDFANVNIPVLQTAGYYFGGPGAATYYFTQHYAFNPAARHYLLIGPWDHIPAQRGVIDALGDTATMLAGYEIDPVARIDIVADIRYRWFDWIMRGGQRPALLADRVNYEVTGQNVWRHAPSIAAMSNGNVRLYLQPAPSGAMHRLTRSQGAVDPGVTLRVDFRNRADIDSTFAGGGIRDTAINAYESLAFVSAPLAGEEMSGLFSGRLSFVTNKKDFDLSVALFELTAKGEYIQLPPLQIRASFARDLSTRHLLVPGVRQTLDFRSIRLMSRKLGRGSRIVAVIGPIKAPSLQINYGSGKPVSEETIADAGEPFELRLLGDSYIDLPVRH